MKSTGPERKESAGDVRFIRVATGPAGGVVIDMKKIIPQIIGDILAARSNYSPNVSLNSQLELNRCPVLSEH